MPSVMALSPLDFSSKPPVKSRWKKGPLIVLVFAIVLTATGVPFHGWFDLVLRPLIVIALLFFIGTKIERRH